MKTPRPTLARRITILAAWTLGAGALVLVIGAISFWLAMRADRRSTAVSVPDLGGLPLADALAAAETVGLRVEVVDERNDASVASGRVLGQDPPAAAQVRVGRTVRVVLSLGGKTVRVPALTGKPAREVAIRLGQDGLTAGDEARAHERIATPGTVIAQVPPAESPALPGGRVHRLVSDGPVPARWVMPDLTGRSLSRVEDWLDLCGLRRGAVRRIPTSGRPSGVVVGQLPLSGYPIPARGVVELTVTE